MRVLSWLWMGAALAVAGEAPPVPDGTCLYGKNRFVWGDETASRSELAYRILSAVRARGIERVVVEGAEGGQVVWPKPRGGTPLRRAASADALMVALAVLKRVEANTEVDVRRQVDEARFHPVSVTWSPHELRIAEGEPSAPYPPPKVDQADLEARYDLRLLEIVEASEGVFLSSDELGAAWTPNRFALIDMAFGMLSAEERAAVGSLAVVRDPYQAMNVSGRPHTSANYLSGKGWINLFDRSLEGDVWSFDGDPRQPVPSFVGILLHELGHALADAPRRQGRPSTVEARYAEVLGDQLGPTIYAGTSPVEGFAESFWLFHADPRALERCLPEVHRWFAEGHHLDDIAGVTEEEPG